MRHVVFASYSIDVAVAFKPYFWWCMCGLLLVGVLLVLAWRFLVESAACECSYIVIWVDIRYFNGVVHLRARTRYTTSNNPARLWPITSPVFSCPYRRSYIGKRQLASHVIK